MTEFGQRLTGGIFDAEVQQVGALSEFWTTSVIGGVLQAWTTAK